MELLCKPWCWTVQHKPTENWAIVGTVRMCSIRVWPKNFEWTRGERDLFANFTATKHPKTQPSWSLPGQQLISTSICPTASLPCHLWTACLVHCGRALVLPVIQQWRLHFGWLSPLSAILKLELNWSTLYFSLDIYIMIMHTYVHTNTSNLYTKNHITCFCKDCISLLSHKHCFFLVLQILIQGSRVGKKRWKAEDLLDSSGTFFAVAKVAGLTDRNGNLPLARQNMAPRAWKTSLTLCFWWLPDTN